VIASAPQLQVFVNEQGPFPGVLNIETERIDITSGTDTHKPDPKWTHVDRAGHFHAFADGKLPTLQPYEKHHACPDPCCACNGEGWSETRYRCRLCGKRVRPGYVVDVPGGTPRTMPGLTTWTVTVTSQAQWDADVSLRVVAGTDEFFGFAAPRLASFDPDGFTYSFDGITELGRRP